MCVSGWEWDSEAKVVLKLNLKNSYKNIKRPSVLMRFYLSLAHLEQLVWEANLFWRWSIWVIKWQPHWIILVFSQWGVISWYCADIVCRCIKSLWIPGNQFQKLSSWEISLLDIPWYESCPLNAIFTSLVVPDQYPL